MSDRVIWHGNDGDEEMTTEEAAKELLDCIFDDMDNARWGHIYMADGSDCVAHVTLELRPLDVEVELA